MLSSDIYMTMFRELIAIHYDGGPFLRNYSNVKMYEAHQVGLQVLNNPGSSLTILPNS